MFRKIIKWLLLILVIPLLLFAIMWVALQFPGPQNWVTQKTIHALSKQLNTKVALERVDIDFFKTVNLSGIYIEDLSKDTLLYANELKVSIGIFSLFDKKININHIGLNGVKGNVKRNERGESSYDFIVRSFSDSLSARKDTSASAWDFGISSVGIDHSTISYEDQQAHHSIQASIGKFQIGVSKMDLKALTFELNQVLLAESQVNISLSTSVENANVQTTNIEPASASSSISFPSIPISLRVAKLTLRENQINLSQNNDTKRVQHHLYLSEWITEDILIHKNLISANIFASNLVYNELPTISTFDVNFSAKADKIDIPLVKVLSGNSIFENKIRLEFKNLDQLIGGQLFDQVNINFVNNRVFSNDFIDFAPLFLTKKQISKIPVGKSIRLTGDITGTSQSLDLKKIDFDLGGKNDLKISGNISNFLTHPVFDVNLDKLQASYQGLTYWLPDSLELPDFSHLGTVVATGKIRGSLEDIQLNNFSLNTNSKTNAKGNFYLTNPMQIKELQFDIKDAVVNSHGSDLQPFLKDSLPDVVWNLGEFGFEGDLRGNIYEYEVDGTLRSAPGKANANLAIDFDSEYKNAEYNGTVALDKFDLGQLLGDTMSFGKMSLNVEVNGSGITSKTIKSKVQGAVKAVEFNQYNYQNVTLNGIINATKFTGNLAIDDPHVTLDFEGIANLDPEDISGNILLNIDTIDFQALNFSDTPLAINTIIRGNFSGSNIDQILGNIAIKDINITNGVHEFRDSLIALVAKEVDAGKELNLSSKIMDLNLLGEFKILDLPEVFKLYLNDYFPVNDILEETDKEVLAKINPNAQKFTFDLNIKELEEISLVLLPERLNVNNFSRGKGIVDTKKRIFDFDFNLLDFEYADNQIDSLNIYIDGTEEKLSADVAFVNLKSKGSVNFPLATLGVTLKESKAQIGLDIEDGAKKLLQWSGVATEVENKFRFVLNEDLIINDEKWLVNPNNELTIGKELIALNKLLLSKDTQRLELFALQNKSNTELDATVDFTNFQLTEISNLLNNPELTFKGTMNGQVELGDINEDLKINSQLNIDDLSLNKTPLGNFIGIAKESNSDESIIIDLSLKGANDANIRGSYFMREGKIDLLADLNFISLVIIEPFLNDLIANSKGGVKGRMSIDGNINSPNVNGILTTQGLSTKLLLNGARYASNQGKITLSNSKIVLSEFKLKDSDGNSALVEGRINHDRFSDINLDLQLATERFRILNTSREDNSLYNGSIFTQANVNITGPSDLLNIKVKATTLSGTNIEIQPLYDDLSVSQEDYIIFGNPNDINAEDSSFVQTYQLGSSGFDLTLDLAVTEDAELNIVIDPLTGDQLDAKGQGELLLTMDPNGKVNILGTYQLVEGAYNFSYENLVKRKFTIDPSSTLTFIGDPLNTRFDILAKYKTAVGLLPLIENEATSLSESEKSIGKRKVPTSVDMKIKGDLKEPEFTFDITVKESASPGITSQVKQKLDDLRSDQSDLNKQVFGLLLFNNFISESSNTGLAQSPANQVLNSVSSLVSDQLNNLAGKYLSGVNLELGFNSYNTGGADNSNISELNLQLSKHLFNDRLTVKVGGDFGLQNQTSSSLNEGGYSSIAGNFILEYQLDKNGKYLLRVFHQADYEALLDASSNKTGVGLRFNKSY